jgi:hypothetical protein
MDRYRLRTLLAEEGLTKEAGEPTDRQYLNLIGKFGHPLSMEDVRLLTVEWKPGGFAYWFSNPLGWLAFDVTDKEIWAGSRRKITAAQLYAWVKAKGGTVKGTGPQRKPVPQSNGYTTEGESVYDPNGAKIGEVSKSDYPGGYDIYLGSGSRPRYQDSVKGRLSAVRKLIRLHEGKSR